MSLLLGILIGAWIGAPIGMFALVLVQAGSRGKVPE